MKKAFLLLSLIFINHNIWATSDDGGMDGGGGGTLPANPVPVYKVQEIVSSAKGRLLYLFNKYEDRMRNRSNSLLEKLYKGPRKVQEVLKDLRVEVRIDKPCLTLKGKEVDASIYGIKPDTICLSAYRISQKIDLAVAEREVLALLMHETSHFMGANEEEATELQKDIARSLLHNPNSDLSDEELRNRVSNVLHFLYQTEEELAANKLDSALESLGKVFHGLYKLDDASHSAVYKLFSPRENDYQDLLRLKIQWGIAYLKTLVPGEDRTYDLKKYNERFGNNHFFKLSDEYGNSQHFYQNEKIYKLNSLQELISLVVNLKNEYDVRSSYVYQTTFGNNWVNIDGHLTKTFNNPWKDFIGTYVVNEAGCSDGKNDYLEKEFTVTQVADTLYLGKKYSGGYSNDRIELGAYNVNTYLNDYGSTSPSSVYLVHEMGGSWSDRFHLNRNISKLTLTIGKNKTFKIVVENTFEDQDVTKQDSQSSCIFVGTVR